MIYETNYKKLLHLIPDLGEADFEARKLKSEGFMDLNIDLLMCEKHRIVVALSHYYKHPSGDMVADPDMEIAVYPDRKMAEALTYQDTFGYRAVYPDDDKVDLRAKKELNAFLGRWLSNLRSRQSSRARAGPVRRQSRPLAPMPSNTVVPPEESATWCPSAPQTGGRLVSMERRAED